MSLSQYFGLAFLIASATLPGTAFLTDAPLPRGEQPTVISTTQASDACGGEQSAQYGPCMEPNGWS